MPIPNKHEIAKGLNIPLRQAITIRRLMDGRADPMSYAPVAEWVNQCCDKPNDSALVMAAINAELGAPAEPKVVFLEPRFNAALLEGRNGPLFTYVDFGDPGLSTVIQWGVDHYTIESMGNAVDNFMSEMYN